MPKSIGTKSLGLVNSGTANKKRIYKVKYVSSFKQDELSFGGVIPALVTPFTSDGLKIDYASFENLVEHVIAGGVNGVVVAGSTGEAATLSEQEYREIVALGVKAVRGRVPVVAGVGTNSTARALELSNFAQEAGADALLVVAPPYNKPQQDGIYAHFKAISEATSLPIMAYNIPGRSAVNILPTTLAKLAADGVIAAIKESSGSVDQILDLIAAIGTAARGVKAVPVLAGDDSLTLPVGGCGGNGIVSVIANVVPERMCALWAAFKRGDLSEAQGINLELLPLMRALFVETNPVPIKAALKMQGVISADFVRLPLLPASDATKAALKGAYSWG